MLNLTRLHLGIAHESQFQGLGIILLHALANAENLPITALVHPATSSETLRTSPAPAALKHDADKIKRVVALDLTIAP